MSLWNKLWNNCKIIIAEQKKVNETNITEISRCVSLKSSSLEIEVKKTCDQEECIREETIVQLQTSNRHPVARNMSVSRSGRCRQKIKRRSVLFDIPELASYNSNEPKIQSIDSLDLKISKGLLMAVESESENQVPVCDITHINK